MVKLNWIFILSWLTLLVIVLIFAFIPNAQATAPFVSISYSLIGIFTALLIINLGSKSNIQNNEVSKEIILSEQQLNQQNSAVTTLLNEKKLLEEQLAELKGSLRNQNPQRADRDEAVEDDSSGTETVSPRTITS